METIKADLDYWTWLFASVQLTLASMLQGAPNVISPGNRTTRPKDNSLQDNSPHENLTLRQLALDSEDKVKR